MLYYQPYGITDADAPYINGNPVDRHDGLDPACRIHLSIRSARSSNLITKLGLAASDADLTQLLKAVRSSAVMYGVDFGTPGTLTATFDPPLDAYTPGLELHIKVCEYLSRPFNI